MGNTITPLICSECGTGNYHMTALGGTACGDCGHSIIPVVDVKPYLEDGEALTYTERGALAVASAD